MDVFAAGENAKAKEKAARFEVETCREKLDLCMRKRSEALARTSSLERFIIPLLESFHGKWRSTNEEIDALRLQLKRDEEAHTIIYNEWALLKGRAEAVRLVDLWKWRAFSRLYPLGEERAEEMRKWVDREIRPYITSLTVARDGWIHYRLTFFTESVSIHRKLRQVIDPWRMETHPRKFQMRKPMWNNEQSNGPWNSLALALFILAPRITSPGREFWCARSYAYGYDWIPQQERQVLLARHNYKPEPPNLNLLEHWMPCMPIVLCKLIGSY